MLIENKLIGLHLMINQRCPSQKQVLWKNALLEGESTVDVGRAKELGALISKQAKILQNVSNIFENDGLTLVDKLTIIKKK